jgi:hypothetical protein
MRRRELIALIGGAIVACTFPAIAQEAGRTYRIGMLFPFPRDTREGLETMTRPGRPMSALPPKADIAKREAHVRFVQERMCRLLTLVVSRISPAPRFR